MSRMDRPDGLNAMRVAAGIGLVLLAVISGVVGFFATLATFSALSIGVVYVIHGDAIIAGLFTATLVWAAILRWRTRGVRAWALAILLGLSVGGWIAAFVNGGTVNV